MCLPSPVISRVPSEASFAKPAVAAPARDELRQQIPERCRKLVFALTTLVVLNLMLSFLLGKTYVSTLQQRHEISNPSLQLCSADESSLILLQKSSMQSLSHTPSDDSLINNLIKPLLIEAGAFALLQFIGIPTLSRFFLLGVRRFRLPLKVSRQALKLAKQLRLPRMMRRAHQSLRRMYNQRSRLSGVSDYTHVLGDTAEENDACVAVDVAP